MKDLNFISLDLEMNQPSEKIIQVGVCVGNLESGKILDTYNAYINCGEQLDERIIKLTGIKQQQVDNGISLFEAYKKLCDLHSQYKTFRNPITWGGGDSKELRDQLHINSDEMFLFGRRWIDAKTLFISYRLSRNEKTQAGLSKALINLGLEFIGKKHSAVDDSINTFIIYRELLKKFNEGI